MPSQQNLFAKFAKELPVGELTWIGVRPERKSPMVELESVEVIEGLGLEGDHRTKKSLGSARQVTIISEEFISHIALFSGKEEVHPSDLRRNLVVKGLNLNALRYQEFWIGEVKFEARALCHPCSRMKVPLGPRGVSSMIGYGGLCLVALNSGRLTLGDKLKVHD